MTSNDEPLTGAEIQKLGDFFYSSKHWESTKDQVACLMSQGAWSKVRIWTTRKEYEKAPEADIDSTELLRRYHVIRESGSWRLPCDIELITGLFNTGQHDTIVKLVNALYDSHTRKLSAGAEAIIALKPSQ